MKKKLLLGLMAMTLPWTAWAGEETKGQFTFVYPDNFVYNGGASQPTFTVKAGESELTPTDDYTIEYLLGNEKTETIKNAGTYTIKIAGANKLAGYGTQEFEFTVERKKLTAVEVIGRLGKQYGKDIEALDFSSVVKLTGVLGDEGGVTSEDATKEEEFADAIKCLYLDPVVDEEEVGEVSLVWLKGKAESDLTGEDHSNYFWNGKQTSIDVDVTKRELEVTLANANSTYNGQGIELSDLTPTVEGVVEGETVTVSITSVDEEKELKDAGKYILIATLDGNDAGNYTLANDGKVSYEIGKATLTISVDKDKTLGKPYDNEAPEEDVTEYFVLTTNPEGIEDEDLEKITLKVEDGKADVGSYDVKLYIDDEEVEDVENQEDLANYDIVLDIDDDQETFKYVISAKQVTYYFKGTNVKYTGEQITTKQYELTVVDGFVDGDDADWETEPAASVKEGTTVKNVDTYELVLSNEPAIDSENYTPVLLTKEDLENEENVNEFEVTPGTMTITVKTQTIDFGTPIDDDLKAKWAQYDSGTGNGSGTVISNDPYGKGNDGPAADRTNMRKLITFEIDEKVEEASYASGTYEKAIKIVLKDSDDELSAELVETLFKNYGGKENINPVNGDLVIRTVNTLELDGAEDAEAMLENNPEAETIPMKLKRLNGATVDEVTIKNLKNVTPAHTTMYTDMWYSLVLPFEVTVREISEVFGYAIVDIPNTNNTNPDAISFKLHMGTIPANTMMLFKVDEIQDWDGKTFTFEKAKKIEYDSEAEPVNDGHNYFIPVYQITELDKENQWYMYYDGKSYNAATNPNTMYPLNGYIEAAAGKNARIYVEEADGTITAINAVTGEAIRNAAEGWYTIGGMKLEGTPTEKGVYINNGMKVVIK